MINNKMTCPLSLLLYAVIGMTPVNGREVNETRLAMGTYVSLTFEDSHGQSDTIIESAFQEINRLERIFSTYRKNTRISSLNREGFLRNISPEFRYVFTRGLHYSELSGGAFDITVKPLLDLYFESYKKQNRPPTECELSQALALVDYNSVSVHENQISFRRDGMQVTLDAIAKGYVIDSVIRVLQNTGIHSALVNIGGDLRGVGVSAAAEPWKIALQHPRDPGVYIAVINLDNKSVATSGDYERYFLPDKRVHHILNPATGLSATSLISATVVSELACRCRCTCDGHVCDGTTTRLIAD